MIGGLLKSTSRLALVAAAGLFVGSGVSPARAADLGGDCCADLEERVAALEATTVRKGNRVVSLTLSGHVDRAILWYNDGSTQGTRSVDNVNSTSRFRLQGSAKIAPNWSMGYYLEVELVTSGSFGTDQIESRRVLPTQVGVAQANGEGNSPLTMGLRQSHWYVKNDQLGTVSVGRLNSALKDGAGVELGNVAIIANSDLRINGGEMFTRTSGKSDRGGLNAAGLGSLSTLRWTSLVPIGDDYRYDGARYDSPTLLGFTLTLSAADNTRYDAALRYAGEFSGLRLAGFAGYSVDQDEGASNSAIDATPDQSGATFGLKSYAVDRRVSKVQGSAWHVPTGIFVTAAYFQREFQGTSNCNGLTAVCPSAAAADFTSVGNGVSHQRPTVNTWYVQGGLRKNWFGLGDTSIYGEYARTTDPVTGLALNLSNGAGGTATGQVGGVNFAQITSSDSTVYGLGAVQNIDKAATSLYLGWRHYSANLEGVACAGGNTTTQCANGVGATTSTTKVKNELQDLDVIMGGAIIKF